MQAAVLESMCEGRPEEEKGCNCIVAGTEGACRVFDLVGSDKDNNKGPNSTTLDFIKLFTVFMPGDDIIHKEQKHDVFTSPFTFSVV